MQSKTKISSGEDRAPPDNVSAQSYSSTKRFRGLVEPNCAKCPFAQNGQPPHTPVLGDVPKDPIAFLIGEAPSREEVSAGRIFVGPTGNFLNGELQQVRLTRSELALVNATACQPPFDSTEGQMRKAVVCCQPLFWSQIRQATVTQETHVLAMGRWAHFALTKKDRGAMSNRGFIREWTWPWL